MRTILWSGDKHFVTVEDAVVAIVVRDKEYEKLLSGELNPADLDYKQTDDLSLTMQCYTTDVWEKPQGAKSRLHLVSKPRLHPRDETFD